MVKEIAGDYNFVWLGGKRELREWTWSDNSTWGYISWSKYSSGDGDCVSSYNEKWEARSCSTSYQFICQETSILKGKKTMSLTYNKDQLKFPRLFVRYKYKAASQQLLDSWEDKRMTGFKLSWRIEKSTLMTNSIKRATPNKKPLLAEMVQLAQYLRIKENLTEEQILDKVISEKMQNIRTLTEQGICSSDQIKSENINKTIPKLMTIVDMKNVEEPVIDHEIMTGFKLYHALVYCPMTVMKLYRFVDHLLSSESKRTIIQSYTNLFHSGVLKGTTIVDLAKAFYMKLATTLNLQYGNILLATSTKSGLQTVIDIDGPFFTNNSDLVKNCILDSKCDRLQDIFEDLGNFSLIHFDQINFSYFSTLSSFLFFTL